ncbi:MAG: hypothetical protein ACM3NN_12780 [Nitrospirota bacterium]|jgi:ElaB/YqjD/DUF883 family membrane-anchored ribosome-binding protein
MAEENPVSQSATARKYRGQSGEVWEQARERVQNLKQDTDTYIRENPTKAVFTALAIGFVLGLIRHR